MGQGRDTRGTNALRKLRFDGFADGLSVGGFARAGGAIAAFITEPMSFIEVAPVSVMAAFTASFISWAEAA